MIGYTSTSYYIFIFIVLSSLSMFNNLLKKKYLILIANIVFQFLFFYFNKKQFLNFFSYVSFNICILYIIQKLEINKKSLNIFVLFNVVFFVLVKYRLGSLNIFFDESNKLVFVGISFVVFKFISLCFDYRNGIVKSFNLVDLYNYISFFPSYLSGPLYKFQNFVEESEKEYSINDQELFDNIFRFVLGAFKKLVIADFLYTFCLEYFSLESAMSFSLGQSVFSLFIYTIVLYLDFSGYSDMAISLSKMLGFVIPENFNKPYLALNIQDFWTRWHISFMNWLRDYIYYPFQMYLLKTVKIKDMNLAIILSTMLIFLITGLWHGDHLNYLLYGSYHAICFAIFLVWKNIILKKFTKEVRIKYFESKMFNFFSWLLTMAYFAFGLSFFINKYQVFFK